MAIGLYKAFKRRDEVCSTEPTVFINNMQVWFSFFAFSTSATTILVATWGWIMLNLPPPWMWGVLAALSIFVIAFILIAIGSLYQLIKMLCRGWRGIPYEFDPDKTPDNVLRAIRPINKETNLSEYKEVLSRLIKEKDKLIKEKSGLIAEYSDCIQDMEKRNDKSKTT